MLYLLGNSSGPDLRFRFLEVGGQLGVHFPDLVVPLVVDHVLFVLGPALGHGAVGGVVGQLGIGEQLLAEDADAVADVEGAVGVEVLFLVAFDRRVQDFARRQRFAGGGHAHRVLRVRLCHLNAISKSKNNFTNEEVICYLQ